MNFSVRQATPDDVPGIVALLPRLADFDIPAHRVPEHLWHGDRDMLQEWKAGQRPEVDVLIACNNEQVVGVAVLSQRKELLSGNPSAHLEVLATDANSVGQGIGSALMKATEALALERGATSISLHVFAVNTRARALYERHGFDGELMRYLKPLKHNSTDDAAAEKV